MIDLIQEIFRLSQSPRVNQCFDNIPYSLVLENDQQPRTRFARCQVFTEVAGHCSAVVADENPASSSGKVQQI